MAAFDGIDDDDIEGLQRACEQMQKEQAAYDKMLTLIESEHKVRSRINDSIDDLQKEMEMIKERKHEFRKASPSSAPGPSSSTTASGRPPLAGGAKSLSKTTSNLMAKLSSKLDDPAESLPGQPGGWTEVPCACGCGEMRKCRSSQVVAPISRRPASDAPSTPMERVDGPAQRAYVEKLAKPREKTQDAPMQRSNSNSSNRPVDLKRLAELAQPKPPPEIPEPTPREPARPAPARSEVEDPALTKLVQSTSGAVGPAMRKPPKKCLSMKSMNAQDNPALANLLRAAEEQHSKALESDRDARWGPTARVSDGDSPPLLSSSWRESRVRSLFAQRSYVDSRLYPGAGSKPGSIEDLNRKLTQLRKERSERGLKLVEGRQSKPTRTSSAPNLEDAAKRTVLQDRPTSDRRRLPSTGVRSEQAGPTTSTRSSKERASSERVESKEEQEDREERAQAERLRQEIQRQEDRLVEERLKHRRGLDRQIDWSLCA